MSFSAARRSTGFGAFLGAVLLAAAAVLLAGCDPGWKYARTVYDTAGLDVERTGWDTLRVRPSFTRRTSLGRPQPAQPETTFVHVFDAEYDTLFSGPVGTPIPIPDHRLASREPLLVETCGVFRPREPEGMRFEDFSLGASPEDAARGRMGGKPPRSDATPAGRALCEQATVLASPKRVRVERADVTFPEDPNFQKGRYDVRFVVERQTFRDTTYEAFEDRGIAPDGVLLARPERAAAGEGTVRVPMSASGHGAFDLSRYDGYDDFEYHLRVGMQPDGAPSGRPAREGESPASTGVAFEVLAQLAGAPPRTVHRTLKRVRQLSPKERRDRARAFAYAAAGKIAEHLLPDEWEDARATVRDWRYDRLDGRYEVTLRVRWFERDDFGDRYTLDGTLSVEEASRRAVFTGEEGNGRAVRRWRRTVDSTRLPLGVLEEPPEDATLPEAEEGRLRDVAERGRPGRRRAGRRSRRHRNGTQ